MRSRRLASTRNHSYLPPTAQGRGACDRRIGVTDVRWKLRCTTTGREYDGMDARFYSDAGSTLDVVHDLDHVRATVDLGTFDRRLGSKQCVDRSGVWRFRELILPVEESMIVTKPEGATNLYESRWLAGQVGLDALSLKHEGENPTGSFKDRGMTAGVTMAKIRGATRVACASTGNTSASMAAYAAQAGMRAFVFIPEGKIAYGKLAQALAYGAKTIQIAGDFDRALDIVQQVCERENIYLLNSVNPFRVEGQKAIAFELLQDLDWQVPDWIVMPGGNLGNSSAIGKGLMEMLELGWIDRLPRIAVVQAHGANPFFRAFTSGQPLVPVQNAETIATAIRIGNPVSWQKSLRGVEASHGLVTEVTDDEIMDAKALVDAAGIGAEPASCATVAGVRKLVADGTIRSDSHVCGVLTGHLLKDPDAVVHYHRGELEGITSRRANAPVPCEATLDAVRRHLD
ncbi:MAG: threonine synthase [Planctomycetes bacterium]|nr:threonine synthase [Planctomycetota bacterium]